jgi:hypothetical protein
VVIINLLSKQPSDRFASAEEVAELLEQCLAHVQQPAMVSLPEVCQQALAARAATSAKRLSLAELARQHWLTLSVVTASVALLVAMPSLLQFGRDPQTAITPLSSPPELEYTGWDDAEQLITDLRLAGDDLEQRVAPLWGAESGSSPLPSDQQVPP